MVLDHTANLLRLSTIALELRSVRADLVKSLRDDRQLATRIKQNLTASETFVKVTGDLLQPPREDKNPGIAEREALQL